MVSNKFLFERVCVCSSACVTHNVHLIIVPFFYTMRAEKTRSLISMSLYNIIYFTKPKIMYT